MSKKYFFFGKLRRDEEPDAFVPPLPGDFSRPCPTPGCPNRVYSFLPGTPQCGHCLREVMRRIFGA